MVVAEVASYDPATDTWRSEPPLPTPRANAVAVSWNDKDPDKYDRNASRLPSGEKRRKRRKGSQSLSRQVLFRDSCSGEMEPA